MTAHARRRAGLLVGWGLVLAAAVYMLLSHRTLAAGGLADAAARSVTAVGAVYLALGCLRGFTLIPSTSLLLAGLPFLPPLPLLALTVIGIVVSSACVYLFAEALHLEEVFAGHRSTIDRLTRMLERYELPIIIGWSFLPLVPTDVICYVCGAVRVSLWKCLLGVAIGESAICALYVSAGAHALRVLRWI